MLANGERQVAPTLDGIRRDHVARYEWAATLLPATAHVIDFACGVGYGSHILARDGRAVLGIDRDLEAIDYARKHYAGLGTPGSATFRCGTIAVVSDLETDSFDAAVCFETIEHLEKPLAFLRELARLAPVLVASVPNETVFPHNGRVLHHFRHYTRDDFSELLARAGYEITGWHGQEGPFSEVAPDVEGRTLVVTARRAKARVRSLDQALGRKPASAPVEPALEPATVPDHVTIVGLGPSCADFFELTRRLGGVSAWCDEVWGLNAIGDVLRCDRVFHMDDLAIQETRAAARPDSNIAAMVNWLKRHPGPVYTSRVRPGYPGLVEFPLEAVLNAGHDSNGGAPYFNSTAAYAIAYAIHIGVKRISAFGLDYTLPNSHRAEQGRACCEFWLGIAAARGIEITVPETTSLMDACAPEPERLYGYDCVDVTLHDREDGGVTVKFTDREVTPTAEEIEARYDHSQHPNRLVAGIRTREETGQ